MSPTKFNPFIPNKTLANTPLADLLPLPDAPIQIDLGTGLGHFLEGMADLAPGHNWFGLEHDGPFLKRAVRRIERKGCKNVRLLTIDGRAFLLESIPSNTIQHIWLNFPDPWPKKKHALRRHTNPWMLELLIDRLQPGGELHLATDVPTYQAEMYAGLAQIPGIQTDPETTWRRAEIGVETKYERKWRKRERPIFYGDWRKETEVPNLAYPYEWSPPPDLHMPALPSPGMYTEKNHSLKIFPARRSTPTQCDFLLIDRETNLMTPGSIIQNGPIILRGVWTPWKIALLTHCLGTTDGPTSICS